MEYKANDVKRKWLDRVNGTRANDHRENGNRADVVAPLATYSDFLIPISLQHRHLKLKYEFS